VLLPYCYGSHPALFDFSALFVEDVDLTNRFQRRNIHGPYSLQGPRL